MKLLTFDPSMTCTGWAAVMTENPGLLLGAGTIKGSGDTHAKRLAEIIDSAAALLAEEMPGAVVIEMPATRGRGHKGFGGRAIMSAPVYGMAVGAVVAAARLHRPGTNIIGVAADNWTRGFPSTANDKGKTKRVQLAADLFKVRPEALGNKGTRGDVADAMLLAYWAASRADYLHTLYDARPIYDAQP